MRVSERKFKPSTIIPILNEVRVGRTRKRHVVDKWSQGDHEQFYGSLCGRWFKKVRCRKIEPGDKTGPFCFRCSEAYKSLRVAAVLMGGLPGPWKGR